MNIIEKAAPAAEYIEKLTKEAAAAAAAGTKRTAANLTVRVIKVGNGAKTQVLTIRKYAVSVYGDLTVQVRGTASKATGGIRGIAKRLSSRRRECAGLGPMISSGIVCARSFFKGSAARANKLRRSWTIASATLCAALALTVALVNSTFCLELYYQGSGVGEVGNLVEVEEVITQAEEELREILGYEYSLGEALSLSAALRKPQADTGEIKKAIISEVDGVEEKYALVVDGTVVGAADEEQVLSGLLDGVLEEFTSEATSSVRFVDDVAVVKQFVSEEVVSDPEVIKTLIAPENEESGFSLAVENVESTLYSEEIPFETEYVDDDTLYDDESRIIEKGESGVVLVTEKLVMLNGVEQSRETAGLMLTKPPVKEVVAVGTVPRPATASYGSYIWPADGIITSTFGYRSTAVGSTDHKGLDIAGRSGQSIYAADGGEVVYSGWMKAYGNVIHIRHDNGEETVYGHNSKLLVSEGERVARGQEIALMGNTGLSTGVHCHFEVRIDGVPVDPLKYLG